MEVQPGDFKTLATTAVQMVPTERLLSLVLPYNDYFGHAMTTGVSLMAQLLPLFRSYPNSSILIPRRGALSTVLQLLMVPSTRIIVAQPDVLYWAHKATLLLRKEPFNIVTAHWAGRSVQELRHTLIAQLFSHLQLPPPLAPELITPTNLTHRHDRHSNGTISTASLVSAPAHTPRGQYVIFLSRPFGGQRSLNPKIQDELLARLRAALAGTRYQLYIFGESSPRGLGPNDAKLDPTSHNAFLTTAQYFLQAAAVIGVHGSAFGNTFLCPDDAVIVEVNIIWRARRQEDSYTTAPAARDGIRATCHNAGQQFYYNVYPQLPSGTLAASFYSDSNIKIRVDDVMAILQLHRIAA